MARRAWEGTLPHSFLRGDPNPESESNSGVIFLFEDGKIEPSERADVRISRSPAATRRRRFGWRSPRPARRCERWAYRRAFLWAFSALMEDTRLTLKDDGCMTRISGNRNQPEDSYEERRERGGRSGELSSRRLLGSRSPLDLPLPADDPSFRPTLCRKRSCTFQESRVIFTVLPVVLRRFRPGSLIGSPDAGLRRSRRRVPGSRTTPAGSRRPACLRGPGPCRSGVGCRPR